MSNNKNGGKFAMGIVDALLGKDQQGDNKSELPEFNNNRLAPRSGVDAHLSQTENLRVAQQRILELEEEIDRLRRENEQLIAAGRTLNQRVEELTSRAEKVSGRLEEEKDNFEDEKQIMTESIQAKDREMARLQDKIKELELRLATDLKKIRVRERELENRLEIIKLESAAVVRNKDELILDLKRRIDQMTMEAEHHRARETSMNERLDKEQEKTRRAVKAMRLASSLLEEEEPQVGQLKKVK